MQNIKFQSMNKPIASTQLIAYRVLSHLRFHVLAHYTVRLPSARCQGLLDHPMLAPDVARAVRSLRQGLL